MSRPSSKPPFPNEHQPAMLQLTPEQAEALEQVELDMLRQRLARHLSEQWPATADRLGARLPEFIAFTSAAAARHGIHVTLAVLRYVNLCFVWGSAFEDKPGFEWARDLLADPRMHEWQKLHHLVRQSVERLGRSNQNGDSGLPIPEVLQATDARLMQMFAGLGMAGRLLLREGIELPLLPCDLELAAIRITDDAPNFEYLVSDTGVSRGPGAPPTAVLRVDAEHPAWPERIHVLTRSTGGGGKPTRLQVRTTSQATCDANRHPHVAFAGKHGAWDLRGGDARAISWPLSAPEPNSALPALFAAIAEETVPDMARLQLSTCALREQGVPLGSGSMQLWTYAADQWLLQLKRSAPDPMHWPERNAVAGSTRVALERDGTALDAAGWEQGFNTLDAQLQAALDKLGAAWERSLGIERAQLTANAAVLCGSAALAWGWHQQSDDLRSPMSMRLQAWLALEAFAIELECTGEMRAGRAHAGLRLSANGAAELHKHLVRRTSSWDDVSEASSDCVARFRVPFKLDIDSFATSEAATVNATSACTGGLVGEAGLRPRVEGGSGCQWYAQLRIEQVTVDISLDEPLLGQSLKTLTLLPAMPLLSWSLG